MQIRNLLLLPALLLAFHLQACGSKQGSTGSGGTEDPGSGGSGDINPYQPVPPNTATIGGEFNLARLMKAASRGKVKVDPWAGSWFPYTRDGIAQAAAKYDRARGAASRAEAWELDNHGTSIPGLQDWWGHCNGWAAAAVLYPEPRAPKTVGGVNFSVADQKALMSEVAMEVTADFFGRRDDDPADRTSTVFQDVSPNQLVLVLANYLGQGLPVIMDRYTGYQVWNHPVAGYEIDPIRPGDVRAPDADNPGVYPVTATMKVWWTRDDVSAGHLTEPFNFADGPSYESRTLRMELWLDGPVQFDSAGTMQSSGKLVLNRQGNAVLGGDWRNDAQLDPANSHPDYLWIPHQVIKSTGYSNPNVDPIWVASQLGGR